MADSENRVLRRCSFCGKTEKEVALLFPAQTGESYICDICVNICAEFIDENFVESAKGDTEELTFETLPRPKEIKEMLDLYVIGQDDAKLALAVASVNYDN